MAEQDQKSLAQHLGTAGVLETWPLLLLLARAVRPGLHEREHLILFGVEDF